MEGFRYEDGNDADAIRIDGDRLVKVTNGHDEKVGRAIDIQKVEQDLDTGAVTVTFRFHYGDGWVTDSLPRDRFTGTGIMALRLKGADIHDGNRYDVWLFLDQREQKTKPILRHTGMGWRTIGGRPCFCHFKGIRVASRYAGDYNLEPAGSLDGWRETVTKHVKGRPALETSMSLGFAAALVELLEELTNLKTLLANFWGDSSTGKTSAAQVALSLWGYPDTGNSGLLRTWNATENALMALLRGNRGVAVGFDEASTSRIENFSSLIYNVAEGREKARLDDRSQFQPAGEWRTVVISTGEMSLLERSGQFTGLRVRLLEIGNARWTDSADHAEALKAGLRANYGHAGPAFVTRLLSEDLDGVRRLWKKYRDRVAKMLPAGPFRERVAGKLALVLTAARLANHYLDLGLNLNSIRDTLVEHEKQNPTEGVDVRAYAAFTEYVQQHRHAFSSGTQGQRNGLVAEDESVVYVLTDVFKRIMGELGFDSPGTILGKWKRNGLLEFEKGKVTKKKILWTGHERTHVYCVRLKEAR